MLYTVDVWEDRSRPKFQVYFVRSKSVEQAEAAVKLALENIDKIKGKELGPDHQGIHADLPENVPLYFTEFESTWMRTG